ncbi:hypothetical protein, partial, partial [Parasitella parasitica]
LSPELIPNENNIIQQPRFARIYIFDSANELQNRMNVAGNLDVSAHTMQSLQNMMHDVNSFVDLFKFMEEINAEQPGVIRDIRMLLRAESSPDARRYNAPTADEIGVLVVGCEDESIILPCNRDIVLRLKGDVEGGCLHLINELHQFYDTLQYMLMFPLGNPGWNINVRKHDTSAMEVGGPTTNGTDRNRAEVSIMQYYSFRLMIRIDLDSNIPRNMQVSLHSFGKLFHQYVVDQYARMEQQRLNFIKFNQRTLRAEIYNGLADAIRLGDTDMRNIRKKDCRVGKPDLFIIFTCNPAWPEIASGLKDNQRPFDRPDLCARIFNLKLKALFHDIVKRSVLAKIVAYCYTIEFQKLGLPHCHMLLILSEDVNPRTSVDIDNIVSAEIPDPATHPLAYETVITAMIHDPCGLLNLEAPCAKNVVCSKRYPFDFNEGTTHGDAEGEKLTYIRRVMP